MAELYIFTPDDDLLAIMSEDNGLLSAPVNDKLNDVSDTPFAFSLDAMVSNAQHVKERNRVVFKDRKGDFREFVIAEVDDSDDMEGPITTATCYPAWQYELRKNYIVERRFRDRLPKAALDVALEGSRYDGHVVDITETATTSFYHINSVDAIWKILEVWGCEFKDTVTLNDKGRINGRNITIYARRGHNNGLRLEIDHNIETIERTVISDPITAVYGWGASLEIEDEEGNKTGGHTRYIDFAEIEWRKSNGDPVDKPKGQKWVGDPELLNAYGLNYDGNLHHLFGEFSNQDYEEKDELLKAAWDYLQENAHPKVNYKVTADIVEGTVDLGDSLQAIDREFARPIEIETRVIGISYDLLDIDGTYEIEFGQSLSLGNIGGEIDDIKREIEENRGKTEEAIRSADGKNTNYYGPNKPDNDSLTEGDLWFEVIEGEYVKTWRYDGESWQIIMDMADKEIEELAEKAHDRADEAYEQAKDSLKNSEEAIDKAQEGFDKAQENASEIESFGIRMEDAEDNITTISGTVEGLQTSIKDNEDNINTITQLAEGNLTKIENAEGDIATISERADAIVSRIDNLQIGGRNLLHSTDFSQNFEDDWYIWGNTQDLSTNNVLGYTFMRVNSENINEGDDFDVRTVFKEIPLKVGVTYTLSWLGVFSGGTEFDNNWIVMSGESNQSLSTYLKREIIDNGDVFGYTKNLYKYTATFELSEKAEGVDEFSVQWKFRATRDGSTWALITEPQLEKSEYATEYSPNPDDAYSQISQLRDAVNIRVKEGDVLAQINLEAGMTLIQNEKLVLDADTTVVTGDFKVGNANIKEVDAGKVTVGTLDGHTLSSGNVIGGYIEQQSSNRRLEMYEGKIESFYNNQLAMKFGQYNIQFYNKRDDKIGELRTASNVENPDLKGLALTIEQDFFNIGVRRAGYIRPVLRTSLESNNTLLAGPYNSGIEGSSLRLYANARIVSNDPGSWEESTSTDQPSIILNQSEDSNDNLQYFGGWNSRSGAIWEVRHNYEDESWRSMLKVTNKDVTARYALKVRGASGIGDGLHIGTGDYSTHVLTKNVTDNYFTIYPQRYTDEDIMRVRSHNGFDEYRNDMRIMYNGDLMIYQQFMTSRDGTNGGFRVGTGDNSSHVMTRHSSNGTLVLYPQRYTSQDIFSVISHNRFGDYSNDLRIRYNKDVEAKKFNETSHERFKENIEPWTDSALDILNDATLYKWDAEDDSEKGYGFVIGDNYDAPDMVISDSGESVSGYAHRSLNTKAIQELSIKQTDTESEIEMLKARIKALEKAG